MIHTSTLTSFAAHLRGIIQSSPWRRDGGALPSFNQLALELFSLQFEANTPYRRVCESLGRTPLDVDDWTRIPAMPTEAFKELDLTSLHVSERTAVFHSSGTTSQRQSRHWHGNESLALYERSLWQWFQPHLVPETTCGGRLKLISMTPAPFAAPHSSLVHMLGVAGRQLGQGDEAFCGRATPDGWQLDVVKLERALAAGVDPDMPVLLVGTAFQFVEWTDQCLSEGASFALPRGSRVLETGGYKGRTRELSRHELHGRITECLGVGAGSIICEYGMSELCSQAYDGAFEMHGHSAMRTRCFQFPPWARSLVISPETGGEVEDGETGLLRVLDLANVWSVAAVQTGDLAKRHGDGFELLGRAANVAPRGCSLMTIDG